jgi:hypothetical protein
MPDTETPLPRCDTCGKLSRTVSRVVVDAGYNRANARPLYNCPECYAAKLLERELAKEEASQSPEGAARP